jgi:hypothetical protein
MEMEFILNVIDNVGLLAVLRQQEMALMFSS